MCAYSYKDVAFGTSACRSPQRGQVLAAEWTDGKEGALVHHIIHRGTCCVRVLSWIFIQMVSTSRTPGHTKHFQTIFLTHSIRLCDCPGLVFPSLVNRQLQVGKQSVDLRQLSLG